MGDVVSIESAKPHTEGPLICMNCQHKWHGIIPVAVTVTECPECHLPKAVREGFVFPDEYYICQFCEGFLFIRSTCGRSLCVNCGQWNGV